MDQKYFFRNSSPQTWTHDILLHLERGQAQHLTCIRLPNGVYEVMSATRALPYLVTPDPDNLVGFRCDCQAGTGNQMCKHLAIAWNAEQEFLERVLATMKAKHPGGARCWTCDTHGNWKPQLRRRVWICGVCGTDHAPEPDPRPRRFERFMPFPQSPQAEPLALGDLDPVIDHPTPEETPEWLI